jgi:hypothetical protein
VLSPTRDGFGNGYHDHFFYGGNQRSMVGVTRWSSQLAGSGRNERRPARCENYRWPYDFYRGLNRVSDVRKLGGQPQPGSRSAAIAKEDRRRSWGTAGRGCGFEATTAGPDPQELSFFLQLPICFGREPAFKNSHETNDDE